MIAIYRILYSVGAATALASPARAQSLETEANKNGDFIFTLIDKIWSLGGGSREFGMAFGDAANLIEWSQILIEKFGITFFIIVIAWLVGKFAKSVVGVLWRAFSRAGSNNNFVNEWLKQILPSIKGIAFIFVQILAVVMILQVWWQNSLSWFMTATGNDLMVSVINIAMVILLALVSWHAASIGLRLYIEHLGKDGNTEIKTQRVKTLLPLAQNALAVLITILAGLVILSELGVSIGPLLAGAGVAGLAIGFGAQTLVKDFINGVFILMEDSVHVGNVVSAAGRTGVVEALTVRTMRLRDLGGTVHVIPFSTVDIVENLSKDFSYALMDIGVGYNEKYDDVVIVLEDIANKISSDSVFGAYITAPLEVMGLNELADSAVVIRVRLKTIPLKQWAVKREFLRLVKERFDQEGIEIPFPHRTLYINTEKTSD